MDGPTSSDYTHGLRDAAASLVMDNQTLRLHAGELTPDQMLAVRAVLKWKWRELMARAEKRASVAGTGPGMTPKETVHPLQVVEETATGPVANDDLPPIELGQLWMSPDPYTAPRRITHVGEGGHLGAGGEHYVHFTTGDGQEMLQLGRHFLEWVRVTGAKPRAAPEAANNAGEATS